MDKKSKIFFLVFFLLIVSSIAVTYYRFMVQRDYMIQAEAECDPYTESCFVYVCDPATETTCTGDPVQDTSYYKLIDRNAKNIPACDPADETCTALVCGEGEADCAYTLCDPATAKDGEACNDPVAYTLENPIEEGSGADTEGDTTGGETDASEEIAPTRESLVLLDEVSCKAGNIFVSADVSNKIPVDADGNYEATFSPEEAQIISLTNVQGQICAKAVSLPVYEGKVYMDAKSTAETSVFQTEGISTTVPEEATSRLALIEESASFPALLAYVQTELPTKNIPILTAQPEFQNLVKKCTEEVVSKLP